MQTQWKSFRKYHAEMMKNNEYKEAYDALGPEFELAAALIERRNRLGLTQAALAKKIGTKQSAIARLESGSYNPSVGLLGKVATALGTRMTISFS